MHVINQCSAGKLFETLYDLKAPTLNSNHEAYYLFNTDKREIKRKNTRSVCIDFQVRKLPYPSKHLSG